jgi:signal transduction histidine kinase
MSCCASGRPDAGSGWEARLTHAWGRSAATSEGEAGALEPLLSNALRFTPEGGRIDVGARSVEEVAGVSVADMGIGIAPEDQDAVFEEFRQVGTPDKKAEGTGLGLALSRRFIELHGGRIWVESHLGAGSTFTCTLPLRR